MDKKHFNEQMKDFEKQIIENPLKLSSEGEDMLSIEEVEELVNEKNLLTDILTTKPDLLVARAKINDHGVWGYIIQKSTDRYKPIGYTLEPTKNIPEKGYIPAGKYKFKRWMSQRLKKTLRLYSVPDFTNVLVHVGNTKSDTRGCILAAYGVDDLQTPTRLITSRKMTDYLYDNFQDGEIGVGWL